MLLGLFLNIKIFALYGLFRMLLTTDSMIMIKGTMLIVLEISKYIKKYIFLRNFIKTNLDDLLISLANQEVNEDLVSIKCLFSV